MFMVSFLSYYRRIPDSFKRVVWPMLMLTLLQKVSIMGLRGKDVIVVVAADLVNKLCTNKEGGFINMWLGNLLPLCQTAAPS